MYGQQQQGRPNHRRWTAVYDRHSVTVRKQIEGISGPRNWPCNGAHCTRYDCAEMFILTHKALVYLHSIRSSDTASLNLLHSFSQAAATLGWSGMVPFERALVSSYRPSILTFPLSSPVSEILPLCAPAHHFSPPHL